jgi:hypothetical protein
LPWWIAPLIAVIGLAALYSGPITTRFLNDDYLFLEEARTVPLSRSLLDLGALANYYRPLSRQVYFAALRSIGGGVPLVFHLVNFAMYLAALALLFDLLASLLPRPGAMACTLYFALVPLQRVNLIWVSCSQDLMALTGCLAAIALYRRGRDRWALLAYLLAIASKEAAPLSPPRSPRGRGGSARGAPPARRLPATARRLVPFALLALAWCGLIAYVRARARSTVAFLEFVPGNFLAGYVHQIQSLLGLDHPPGMVDALWRHGPALIPLALLALLAAWVGVETAARFETAVGAGVAHASEGGAGASGGLGAPMLFGVAWLAVFGVPTGPVVRTWSSYYYTVSGVGAAIIAASLLRRIDRWGWIALTAILLWWQAAGTSTAAFAVKDRAWGWTSHLTTFYFERGARLVGQLSAELERIEPTPEHGTRFFFATLPPWAGFQGGNGPLVRALYRDQSLCSYYYSQFSDTTPGGAPCRFLYWDGVHLVPLYPHVPDPWFQTGSDLLLFDRPAGAAHAFRRGLEGGEDRRDLLYWLGWAELWRGHRARAEAAWSAFGARDDSLQWREALKEARDALVYDADSLTARRDLMRSIGFGIGRPDAHGALGELLEGRQPKYALLELKVAAFLNPNDIRARKHLVTGLSAARLDDARHALLEMMRDERAPHGFEHQVRRGLVEPADSIAANVGP